MSAETQRSDIVRGVAVASFAITSVIGLAVVGTACWMWSKGVALPDGLGILLTAAVTYIFTTLPNIVKSYLDKPEV